MGTLAFILFLVACATSVALAVYVGLVRDLRRQVGQLQAHIAGLGQNLTGMHYQLQTEAGGRYAAQQQVQAAQHHVQKAVQSVGQQLEAARLEAQTQRKQAEAAWLEVTAAQKAAQKALAEQARRAEADAKQAGRELERLGKEVADTQKRGQQVADRYVGDVVKRSESEMTSSSFETVRSRVDRVLSFCKAKGFPTTPARDAEISRALGEAFEGAVRKEDAREEQRRIKEQIREEQRAERDRQKELERLEADERRLEAALTEALAKAQASAALAKGTYDAEVERLKQQLADAEARAQRAKSQAQLTKAGFVYVISNIGSFGEGTFKVGMTRRLEPMDRVIELGDASVPFPFDVHMMISCEDAPSLEAALHRDLNHYRVNKVNLRKEFFRVGLDELVQTVSKHHGKIEYRAEPEAVEYRETRLMEQRGLDPVYDPSRDEDNEDAPVPVPREQGETVDA